MSDGEAVQVAVRCRPFNGREKEINSALIVEMTDTQTIVTNPENGEVKKYTFDYSYWSHEPGNKDRHVDNTYVYKTLGQGVLKQALKGFNACVFAYGQTGAGKTFSMMGASFDVGIVPRMCEDLFAIIDKDQTELAQFEVEVSFFEIYNEQVFDLLKHTGKPMKVRNHKVLGPYVEGLAKLAVESFARINELMEEGNKNKTVAATNMNATSSRGHSIFTVELKQTNYQKLDNGKLKSLGSKASKISLVDLAGSERQTKTGASGAKLKEGANINKSLTTLGMVIAALAEPAKAGKKAHIPYRDSALTFLLQQGLGGNSKTVMVAAISPAADNYDESMSTLRYADRAKQIVNKAVVNEDATARIIRELREEIEAMKAAGMGGGGVAALPGGMTTEEFEKMKTEMAENARLLAEFQMSKSEKVGLSDDHATEIQAKAEAAAAEKEAENAALKAESDRISAEKEAMEAQLAEKEAVQAEKDRQIEELLAKMKAMETGEFSAMEAAAAAAPAVSDADAAAFAALGIPVPAAAPGGGGGDGGAAAAAIKAQLDALQVEQAHAAEAAAVQAAENAAHALKQQIDSIVSESKTTVTHRDDHSENDHSMIASLTYSITDLEDRIMDGDEPDPEGATKAVVQDVSNMIVQADFMVEAAVIRIGDASRQTCKAIATASPAEGIVFNEVRQGQLDAYKQMMIKQVEDQGMAEIAKAKAKFASNSAKLEKSRARLMKHVGDAASKKAFQEEEKGRLAAAFEASMAEERAKNEADYQAKLAEMEKMKVEMAANAAAAAAAGSGGGGGGRTANAQVTAVIQAKAEKKKAAVEATANVELAKVQEEKENIAAMEMMGIDQSAAKAILEEREASAKATVAAAKKAMEAEIAEASTSAEALQAELQAQAEAEMNEMEAMRAAHQAKLDAIKRNKEKLTANFMIKHQAEIAEVAESNNPFLNPFAQAVDTSEASAPTSLNPFGTPAGGAKAAANVDVKKKKEKFTRQLTMQKAKQKSTESDAQPVVAWFGTKSAELHDAEKDYEDAKILQDGRAQKEKSSGLSAKSRMVKASAMKLHKDYSEKVASVRAKVSEGQAGGELKHKHKLVKQLDDYEKEILVGVSKEATLLTACETEVDMIQSGNQRFKGDMSAAEASCRADGMDEAEIDFIVSKYKVTNSQNEVRYTAALETVAGANEAMVKFTAPLKEMCQTLMATLLFPDADSPAARQAAIKAGDAAKDEKVKKYKELIHRMANSEMGDTSYDKASILKYIEKATGKKEVLLKKILGGIGKHSVHGLLFMSGKKVEAPWEARHVYFDLRDRCVTIKTADNKKQLKQASLRTVRAVSFFPKTERRMQSNGKSCEFAFCVMLQPPGKAAETWEFSAMNEMEMRIWKCTFEAAPPPEHSYR